MTTRTTPKRQGCTFEPDDTIPADWRGRQTCRHCHRTGAPDDAGHRPDRPTPAKALPPTIAAAAQALDAAVLGERDETTEDLLVHYEGRRSA